MQLSSALAMFGAADCDEFTVLLCPGHSDLEGGRCCVLVVIALLAGRSPLPPCDLLQVSVGDGCFDSCVSKQPTPTLPLGVFTNIYSEMSFMFYLVKAKRGGILCIRVCSY